MGLPNVQQKGHLDNKGKKRVSYNTQMVGVGDASRLAWIPIVVGGQQRTCVEGNAHEFGLDGEAEEATMCIQVGLHIGSHDLRVVPQVDQECGASPAALGSHGVEGYAPQ